MSVSAVMATPTSEPQRGTGVLHTAAGHVHGSPQLDLNPRKLRPVLLLFASIRERP